MNIFLIGFMGCGKSTLGKKLAKKMDYAFIDIDKEIVTSEGKSIEDIFKEQGETYFRTLETNWLHQFTGTNTIVSVGGGTPCFNNNLTQMHKKGASIYLKVEVKMLTERLINAKNKRPLIEKFKHGKILLESEIKRLLSDREVYYNQASISLEASNMSNTKIDLLVKTINGIV